MQASNVVAYQWNIVQDRVTRLRSSSEPGAALEDAGNFESVVARVLEEDQQTFRNDIAARCSATGGTAWSERTSGPTVRFAGSVNPGGVLRDEQGRSECMVGVTFDITDRKHAEEALRQAEVYACASRPRRTRPASSRCSTRPSATWTAAKAAWAWGWRW